MYPPLTLSDSRASTLDPAISADWHQMVEMLPAMCWVSDAAGNIVHVNSAWSQATGYAPSETDALRIQSVIHPEDVELLSQPAIHFQEDGRTYEFRLRYAGGAYRWVRERVTARCDDDGHVLGYIGCAIDINAEKSSEDMLTLLSLRQTSLTHFSELALRDDPDGQVDGGALQLLCDVLLLPCGILMLRKDAEPHYFPEATVGTESLEIRPFKAIGLAPAHVCELPGDRGQFPLHKDDLDLLGCKGGFAVPIGHSSPPHGYLIGLQPDNAPIPMESLHFARSLAGILAVSIERGWAARKLSQSETRAREAQQMEAVGLLAGGVAHDLNNLLTAIRCFSDLLKEDSDSPNELSKIDNIIYACSSATHLVRQLLSFSRKEVTQAEPIDLNQFVEELQGFLSSLLSECIVLNFASSPEAVWVRADRKQLEQAFFNVCLNARDAMPTEGTLSISIERRAIKTGDGVGQLTPGDYVALTVTDTGKGMTPDVAERIFQPFFTTKPRGKGTGLGLATCLVTLRDAGGDITVTSAPGQGSTFSLWFPEEVCSFAEDEFDTEHGDGLAEKSNILLVEDDELVRSVASMLIKSIGHEVESFGSPQEALAFAESEGLANIPLLVTDIVMPGMNGHEMAQKLLTLKPDLKIIYMSGYVDNPATEIAIADPQVDFLPKPFSAVEFASLLNKCLSEAST